jgi:DNA-binding transcriptional regulator YdaS (Cro superfamily)
MKTQEAISFFGTQSKLAEALAITDGAVSQWGEYPPRLRQLEIQALTDGQLVAEPKQSQAAA